MQWDPYYPYKVSGGQKILHPHPPVGYIAAQNAGTSLKIYTTWTILYWNCSCTNASVFVNSKLYTTLLICHSIVVYSHLEPLSPHFPEFQRSARRMNTVAENKAPFLTFALNRLSTSGEVCSKVTEGPYVARGMSVCLSPIAEWKLFLFVFEWMVKPLWTVTKGWVGCCQEGEMVGTWRKSHRQGILVV